MLATCEKPQPDVARAGAIGYIALSGGISAGIAGAASIAYFWPIISPILATILTISLLNWMVLAGIAAGIIGCLIAGTMAYFLLKHTHIVNYYGTQASFVTSIIIGIGGSILSLFIPIPGLGSILALEALAGITILTAFTAGIVTNMLFPTGYDIVRSDKKDDVFNSVPIHYSRDAHAIYGVNNSKAAPAPTAALASSPPQKEPATLRP